MRDLGNERWERNAELAWRALRGAPTEGIPSWGLFVMEHGEIERLAGSAPGAYQEDPDGVYLAMQRRVGTCYIDQYIPRNPLTMGDHGFEGGVAHGATTGAQEIVVDGMVIDGPEAVVEHLEAHIWPSLRQEIAACDPDDDAAVAALVAGERETQWILAPSILKTPYAGFNAIPSLRYGIYGYEAYLMAYGLYPEAMEQDFALQAELARRQNQLAARAIVEGGLAPVVRLDHDMADARGTLVSVASLERRWLPHLERAIAPLVEAGVRCLWHCDGNLMGLLPCLLAAGVAGFQGFQYEHGMDYAHICRMRTRDGDPVMIWAGVSVTTTLPHGTPADVRAELRWLVEEGPPSGLCLGASSSITPGVPPANLDALVEGLAHYRAGGR